jgi:hypothetical protein
MQQEYALSRRRRSGTLAAAAKRILAELPTTMSGSLRAQHLGIYYAILALTEIGEPATANAIADFVKLATSHVNAAAKRLLELGVLERDRIPASHGRSFRYIYRPTADYSTMRQSIAEQDAPTPKGT